MQIASYTLIIKLERKQALEIRCLKFDWFDNKIVLIDNY